MRVHLGSDHAGFELKNRLAHWLGEQGHEVVDHGPHVYDAQDDYPPFCLRAAQGVLDGTDGRAVVVGGSGNGEQMAANKVRGVRAALVWSEETAALARQHNDANVVAVGARMHSGADAVRLVEVFLDTAYSGEHRHDRRIEMVSRFEQTGELPPLPPGSVRA